mgnify:CR=1 FL=1
MYRWWRFHWEQGHLAQIVELAVGVAGGTPLMSQQGVPTIRVTIAL